MEEILDNLYVDEILHVTSRKTHYLYHCRTFNGGIKYSINQNSKILPLATILTSLNDTNNGVMINAGWYRNYNAQEYRNNPCNLSVLKGLLNRLQ